MRHTLTTVAVALFGAAAMAGLAAPASAAIAHPAAAARPATIHYVLWGYFADMPTCYHQGAILAGENPQWVGYYCQVDPTRPATNVGLWYGQQG